MTSSVTFPPDSISATPTSSPTSKERLIFIDVLRGVAAVWMILVHITDVCLSTEQKHGFIYNMLNVSFGFVSVCFVFCAGVGFMLAAEKKIADYRSFKKPLWQYLKRLGHILLLAYWLNLPAFSFQRTMQSTHQEWMRFLECDVLHCIVYSSLIALILSMIIGNMKTARWVYLGLAILFTLGTPFVWLWNPFDVLPMGIALLFAKYPISKFPLFPISAYFFFGAFLSSVFVAQKNKLATAKRWLTISLILPFILFTIKYSPLDYPGYEDWWYVSPGHTLYRVSCVIALFCFLYLIQERYAGKSIGNFLQISGQESLFFYVFHLMLTYGTIANFGLVYLASHRYNQNETALVFVVITAVTYSFAAMWHRYKKTFPADASRLVFWLMILFLVIFLLVPSYLA